MIHLYIKTQCPYSQFAIGLASQSGQPYKLINVDDPKIWKETKRILSDITGVTISTVPQAFWQDDSDKGQKNIIYIGDSDNFREWLSQTDLLLTN